MINKVLLIDDDDTTNFYNQYLIKKKEISQNVDIAINGELGIQYLQKNIDNNEELPNLILLDVNMPKMNGFEFLKKFSEFPQNIQQNITIIMLTTSIHSKDVEKAGVTKIVRGYLPKPIDIIELQKIITKK